MKSTLEKKISGNSCFVEATIRFRMDVPSCFNTIFDINVSTEAFIADLFSKELKDLPTIKSMSLFNSERSKKPVAEISYSHNGKILDPKNYEQC